MNFYSYKLEHDYGLAPNPFGEYCTLAVCKGKIRANKNLSLKDWIIGTGSKALLAEHKLIYVMQVDEIISFDEYWEDERFQYKKPVINGSLVQIHGDNIYHKDEKTGEWIQENSAHSGKDGCLNQEHLEADTKGKNVLISTHFYYLGDKAATIPDAFLKICTDSRDMMYKAIDQNFGKQFIEWVKSNFKHGINGDPISWKEYFKK
jgi:hypothetical protein